MERGWRELSKGFQRSRRETRRAWEFHRILEGEGGERKRTRYCQPFQLLQRGQSDAAPAHALDLMADNSLSWNDREEA